MFPTQPGRSKLLSFKKTPGHISHEWEPLQRFRLDTGSSMMLQTEVRGRILALVYYLQSLQEKAEKP